MKKSCLARQLEGHASSQELRFKGLLLKCGIKFFHQFDLHPYVIDFYLPHPKNLVIEIDGKQHRSAKAQAYDRMRTYWLSKKKGREGLRVIRFSNEDIDLKTDEDLIEMIEGVLCQSHS